MAPHFPASGCTSHPVLLFTEVTKNFPESSVGKLMSWPHPKRWVNT